MSKISVAIIIFVISVSSAQAERYCYTVHDRYLSRPIGICRDMGWGPGAGRRFICTWRGCRWQ